MLSSQSVILIYSYISLYISWNKSASNVLSSYAYYTHKPLQKHDLTDRKLSFHFNFTDSHITTRNVNTSNGTCICISPFYRLKTCDPEELGMKLAIIQSEETDGLQYLFWVWPPTAWTHPHLLFAEEECVPAMMDFAKILSHAHETPKRHVPTSARLHPKISGCTWHHWYGFSHWMLVFLTQLNIDYAQPTAK